MRILLIEPGVSFSVADVHRGWVKALRQLGHDVANFNFDDRLAFYSSIHLKDLTTGEFGKALDAKGAAIIAAKGVELAAFEFWPDLIIVTSGFYIPDELYGLLRSRGMRIVLNHLEAPYEDAAVIKRAGLFDAVMINDPTNLDAGLRSHIVLKHRRIECIFHWLCADEPRADQLIRERVLAFNRHLRPAGADLHLVPPDTRRLAITCTCYDKMMESVNGFDEN